jgi:hypothetical protein
MFQAVDLPWDIGFLVSSYVMSCTTSGPWTEAAIEDEINLFSNIMANTTR